MTIRSLLLFLFAMLDQIGMMRTPFPDYKSYAGATIDKIFTPEEMKGAKQLTANYLSTACFMSNSQGKLHSVSLPLEAQYSPVYTITSFDYDHDGNEDLLLCGNINHGRLRFGKYDANYGVLLKGNGKGNYRYISQQQSGFNLLGDVRNVLSIKGVLLFGMDEGRLKAYKQP